MAACCNYKNAVQNLLKYYSHWTASFVGLFAYIYGIRLPLIGQAMCEHSTPAFIFSAGVSLLLFHHCLWPETLTRPPVALLILYYAVASVVIMNLSHLLIWQTCLLLLRLLFRSAAQGLYRLNELAALGKGSVVHAGADALFEQSKKSTLPLVLSFSLFAWVCHAVGWMDPKNCFSPLMLLKQLKSSDHRQSMHNLRSSSRGRGRRRRQNITMDNVHFDDD